MPHQVFDPPVKETSVEEVEIINVNHADNRLRVSFRVPNEEEAKRFLKLLAEICHHQGDVVRWVAEKMAAQKADAHAKELHFDELVQGRGR